MKAKLYLLSLFVATNVNAHLIDVTPGTSPIDFGPPAPVSANGFLDEAAFGTFDLPTGRTFIQGWVSQFGILNGGQFFFTDLFNQPSPPLTATVSWDFTGSGGFRLGWLDVIGFNPETHVFQSNIYRVTFDERFIGEGVVTLDGQMPINGIAFYGHNPVRPLPDTGSTLLLMLLAWVGVIGLERATGCSIICSKNSPLCGARIFVGRPRCAVQRCACKRSVLHAEL